MIPQPKYTQSNKLRAHPTKHLKSSNGTLLWAFSPSGARLATCLTAMIAAPSLSEAFRRTDLENPRPPLDFPLVIQFTD